MQTMHAHSRPVSLAPGPSSEHYELLPVLASTSDTETASPYALLEGQHLAPAVQEAPTYSLVLPPGCWLVPSKNASMYGKKMCDVHIAGFSMESDKVIRFRSSDGKVVVADLLVAMGRFVSVSMAQKVILQWIDIKHDKIDDLVSLEVDKKMADKVSHLSLMIFLNLYKFILK